MVVAMSDGQSTSGNGAGAPDPPLFAEEVFAGHSGQSPPNGCPAADNQERGKHLGREEGTSL